MSARPLTRITGRELLGAMLDAQALAERPMSLHEAMLAVGAAWTCQPCGALALRGDGCALCGRCVCRLPLDDGPDGGPCSVCGYRLVWPD